MSSSEYDLNDLEYDPQNFRDLYDTDLGRNLWSKLKEPDNLIRMETATFLERAAVEPLAPGLVKEFGAELADGRTKQMIGHMVRQIMEALGHELDRHGLRITRPSLFTSGSRYRRPDARRERKMTITREQREAWLKNTKSSPFNQWLDKQVKREDGTLDLDRLYEVAQRYGVEERYSHLNAGQIRMNIGVKLRSKVPAKEYE